MSDNNAPASASASVGPVPGLAFTDRENQMLGWAMQSLKTGPPEASIPHPQILPLQPIDYEKLAKFAGMSNTRSASNSWAKIRAKLVADPPADGAVPATPKKAGGRQKKAVNTDEGGEPTPNKTPRKRAAKKQDVDGDASPKKKGRSKAPAKSERE
ncbi:hypothetical protein GQ44DRAFT_639856 [Phaeosphaeriaceae sp. PMI808]|nr:hypothetical protein GQ44DRAFT_639856 [Phaeosphaeriaceae sp. PMI808]